ncbi:MAG TPA: hypothetical protein VGD67_20000, partial [Pseudonocardiaceae bacterium]
RGRTDRPVAFALSPEALARLSDGTRALLDAAALDPARHPLDAVVELLTTELERRVRSGHRPAPLPPPPDDPEVERPYLRDVGVADLLVVKQHLTRYQRMDIAHVENVLIGEKKSRNHRELERVEETVTVERETTTERESELETADRFELNREASRTVKRDQEFGFGLSLSGKYGPSVEFSSEVRASSETSTEESVTSATTYARDVVERSLERVIERVREEMVRRVVREREEVNLHELHNETGQHISGIYQFIEKVYESQVFNYGIRQMFDFMVPEPSSYVWHLERSTSELALPTPPVPLETEAPDASAVNLATYRRLAALYGAEGITAPPPVFLTSSATLMHGEGADDDGEEGQPRSTQTPDLAIPDGYRPYRASVQLMALTDDHLTVAVTVGKAQRIWRPVGVAVGSDHSLASSSLDLGLFTGSSAYEGQSKMPVHLLAYETNSYSASVDVVFARTLELYRAWQLSTYEKLVDAYQRKLQIYTSEVAEVRAKAEAEAERSSSRFVAPPTQNLQTVRNELKKHCISIVTRQRYGQFQATQDTDPPHFDFERAETEGSFIRFFEQAFEWDQLQYVLYPYYWGRRGTWAERFLRQDADPAWLEFLRSGAARVVVPARPGFEPAIAYYLETGEIWRGGDPADPTDPLGGLPDINDPLYVSILTELMERADAPQGEIPVGEPWRTHVPTPLVVLRPDDSLPRWERADPTGWEWEEDE